MNSSRLESCILSIWGPPQQSPPHLKENEQFSEDHRMQSAGKALNPMPAMAALDMRGCQGPSTIAKRVWCQSFSTWSGLVIA